MTGAGLAAHQRRRFHDGVGCVISRTFAVYDDDSDVSGALKSAAKGSAEYIEASTVTGLADRCASTAGSNCNLKEYSATVTSMLA